MDQDGDGHISLKELVNIGKEKVDDTRRINNLKKYLVAGGCIMLVFIAVRPAVLSPISVRGRRRLAPP